MSNSLSAVVQRTVFILSVLGPASGMAEQAAPPANDDLNLGQSVEQTVEPGKPYVRETNGDWDLECVKVESGPEPCQMYQLLSDDQGTPVAEVSLFRLSGGGQAEAGATIVVPLETALQQQLTIQIDEHPARVYPYAFCNQIGCYARVGLTAEDVERMKRGNTALLSIVPYQAPDQKLELPLSLTGFTVSYDKIDEIQQ